MAEGKREQAQPLTCCRDSACIPCANIPVGKTTHLADQVAENWTLPTVGGTEKLHGKGYEYKKGQKIGTVKAIYHNMYMLELVKLNMDMIWE